MSTGALERLVRRAGARREELAATCDMCRVPVPEDHRHLLDVDQQQALCVCQPCRLLFVQDAASEGHFRLIPERRSRLTGISAESLGVPVGLAYFVACDDGTVLAHYPSPIGATESEVDQDAWHHVVEQADGLSTLRPEVEALLVNTSQGRDEHWIVPVDTCFRLVALVRREWRGLSGGTTVWPAVGQFFDDLEPHA